MERGMERGMDVKFCNESNKHVNWSWRELISRSRVLVTCHTAQPRRLATRDYRQVVCPGCQKFTVDNKMLLA